MYTPSLTRRCVQRAKILKKWLKMKALITGIDGFVGPYLEKFLISNDIRTFGTFLQSNIQKENHFQMDITNKEEVFNIIKKISPDLIFHLAGFSSVSRSFEQPDLCRKINVEGTRNILDAVVKLKLNTKIIVVSSSEVYGTPLSTPMKENHPLNPSSPYGRSRVEQESVCADYVKKYNIFIVVSRSFNHTGPGQQPFFVVPGFAKQIVDIEKGKQQNIKVGNLEAVRDFTDVRDVVRAYYLLATKGRKGEVYNVCSGNGYLISWILKTLLGLSKVKIAVEKDPEKLRPSDIPVLQGDNSKLTEETGWKPEIDFKKTLKDVLDYFRG
jgi:GDP-4-dehydro-6-deoxy-D-mannose reductase